MPYTPAANVKLNKPIEDPRLTKKWNTSWDIIEKIGSLTKQINELKNKLPNETIQPYLKEALFVGINKLNIAVNDFETDYRMYIDQYKGF